MKACQHIPGFVTGFEPNVAEVETLEELLALPWVKQWENARFHRWSISDAKYLMCERDGGAKWWVVAILSDTPPSLPLPVWHAPEKPR